MIDSAHIVDTMKSDWGFYHTAVNNIAKVEEALRGYSVLPPDVVEAVQGRLETLSARIETAPKTTRWKLRARVGTRTRWYEDVDEVDR